MTNRDGIIAAYAEMLLKYHRTLDLISDQALADLDRHISEARAYARLIEEHVNQAPTVVDLGSGAGLPGVVIAALLPAARVNLVERRRRRRAFLELVTSRLGLSNTAVHGQDVRRLSGVCADVVTAQAVGSLAEVIGLTRHLQRDPCLLLSRRGANWRTELDQAAAVLEGEAGAAFAVLAEEPLEHRGSLVALRLAGGPACRASE